MIGHYQALKGERFGQIQKNLTNHANLLEGGGTGAPEGFDPNIFLAPGIPRVRPLLVLLSERATRAHVDACQLPLTTFHHRRRSASGTPMRTRRRGRMSAALPVIDLSADAQGLLHL